MRTTKFLVHVWFATCFRRVSVIVASIRTRAVGPSRPTVHRATRRLEKAVSSARKVKASHVGLRLTLHRRRVTEGPPGGDVLARVGSEVGVDDRRGWPPGRLPARWSQPGLARRKARHQDDDRAARLHRPPVPRGERGGRAGRSSEPHWGPGARVAGGPQGAYVLIPVMNRATPTSSAALLGLQQFKRLDARRPPRGNERRRQCSGRHEQRDAHERQGIERLDAVQE